jgi:hypothetical protein
MAKAGVMFAAVLAVLIGIPSLLLSHALDSFAVCAALGVIGVLALVSMIGIGFDRKWGWPLFLITLSLKLFHFLWIYHYLGPSITIGFGMLFNIAAILVAIVAVDMWEPGSSPATWEQVQKQAKIVNIMPKVAGGSKKNSSKKAPRKSAKKSSRKSAKKSTRKRATKKRRK